MNNRKNSSSENIQGICLVLLNAFMLSFLFLTMKLLTKEISSSTAVLLNKGFTFTCLLMFFCFKGFAHLKTQKIILHIVRGLFSLLGALCIFKAISRLELADVTAIGYLEQIMLVTIGLIYFKERFSKTKMLAILLCFIGAISVIYPQFILNLYIVVAYGFSYTSALKTDPYYFYMFMAVGFYTANSLLVKFLGRTEKPVTQVFYLNMFSAIYAIPTGLFTWSYNSGGWLPDVNMINIEEILLNSTVLKLVVLASCINLCTSIIYFLALKKADLSIIMPFDYSKLVFSAFLGYLFFVELPEFGSVFGYLLIMFSGLILIRSESRNKRLEEKLRRQLLREELTHA